LGGKAGLKEKVVEKKESWKGASASRKEKFHRGLRDNGVHPGEGGKFMTDRYGKKSHRGEEVIDERTTV